MIKIITRATYDKLKEFEILYNNLQGLYHDLTSKPKRKIFCNAIKCMDNVNGECILHELSLKKSVYEYGDAKIIVSKCTDFDEEGIYDCLDPKDKISIGNNN